MTKKKVTQVNNLAELRYKMAEKLAAFENGELTAKDAGVYINFGAVITQMCKTEAINNHFLGVTKSIDFLDSSYRNPADQRLQSPLLDEFTRK